MKRVAMTLAVLLVLAVTSVALAAGGGLRGAYKTVIKHPKMLKGTWVVTFTKGHYRVTNNGTLILKGKDKIKRHKVSLTDTGGPGKCKGTGKYKFKLTAGKLKFTKISDTKRCARRARVLSHTFTGSRSVSTSISASPSQTTDGKNVTVSFTMTHPKARDYIMLVTRNKKYGGVWFFDNSCAETPGSSPAGSGSCTVSTSPVAPGFYTWVLYRSNGAVAALSATQTIVANTTKGSCPTPEPTGNVPSGGHTWTLVGKDDFNKAASVGSFATSNGNTVVYTGDQGLKWTEYGDGWSSTFSGSNEGYQPSTVQSVHDGALDWYLHSDSNGNPVGATATPVLTGGSDYQTYGRYSFCEKIVPADTHFLDDFKQAIILWPQNQSDGPYAESDFPEGNLNRNVFNAFAHYGVNSLQDVFWTEAINTNQWHVYTQEWGPGYRSYYIDGQLVGTSTNRVWSEPERWNLQMEPAQGLNDGATGHVYVDWVAIWSY